MNFEEAVDEVVSTTKRPEFRSRARREVNSAIRLYTSMANFAADIEEDLVTLDGNVYVQSFDLALLTRFRKFYYVKLNLSDCHHFLYPLAVENLYKKNIDYDNKYYISGTQVNIKSTKLADELKVGWFKYPATLSGTLEHWMLTEEPYMIIDRAVGRIFQSIGDDKSAADHIKAADLAFLTVRSDRGLAS